GIVTVSSFMLVVRVCTAGLAKAMLNGVLALGAWQRPTRESGAAVDLYWLGDIGSAAGRVEGGNLVEDAGRYRGTRLEGAFGGFGTSVPLGLVPAAEIGDGGRGHG